LPLSSAAGKSFSPEKMGTKDVLRQAFPPPLVLAFDFDLVVNAENRNFFRVFDQFLAGPFPH